MAIVTSADDAGSFAEALHQAQILTLRQIGDNVAAQTKRLEGLTNKVDDVRERLARLEAQEAGKLVEALRGELRTALGRIDLLEAQRDRVDDVARMVRPRQHRRDRDGARFHLLEGV